MCHLNERRLFCSLDEKNNRVLGTHRTKNFFRASRHDTLATPLIALLAALALAAFVARAALGETVSAEDAAGTEAVRVKGDAKALELACRAAEVRCVSSPDQIF